MIELLKQLNRDFPLPMVLEWANNTDLDYTEMTDLEIYIKFLETTQVTS
jgi:hypothetical protein